MSEIISRKEAKARGLKRYFTGKPCKHGHLSERFVQGARCQQCEAIRNQNYYARNPTRKKLYVAKRRADHPAVYQRQLESNRKYFAKYYSVNGDAVRAKSAERQRKATIALQVLERLGIGI